MLNSDQGTATNELPRQSPEDHSLKATNKKRNHHQLSRLVSQDELSGNESKKSIPNNDEKVCCGASACEASSKTEDGEASSDNLPPSTTPPLPNPLNDSTMLKTHVAALRLEADLYPIRLVLSRLMAHQTHNKKGLFNHPVDPIALGLADYHTVVTRPMDLGTVKRRLHAVAYQSRQHAVDDIRLVFTNAMRYNPPQHIVHICAKELLSYFDRYCEVLDPCLLIPTQPMEVTAASDTTTMAQSPTPATLPSSTTDEVASASCTTTTELTTPAVASTTQPQETPLKSGGSPVTTRKSSEIKSVTNANMRPRVRIPKRRSSFTQKGNSHACQECQGRTCSICLQGCLQHEPALLVCCGPYCSGARIRKGAVYYITRDGTQQFCDRCFPGLPSTLLHSVESGTFRYKQDLLKRKNDEEIAEEWIACGKCNVGVHAVCAMHDGFVDDSTNFVCPECSSHDNPSMDVECSTEKQCDSVYTFVSGSDEPLPISSVRKSSSDLLDSDSLAQCRISRFIQEKVQEVLKDCPNASKTITVRIISDCDREFSVPSVIKRYFLMKSQSDDVVEPPTSVHYRQKAIAMFQKIDGLDVCVFCMYVQEYDGDDDGPNRKRVYIAYIDSGGTFSPSRITNASVSRDTNCIPSYGPGT